MESKEVRDVTDLLLRCRARDDAAFAELVRLYTPMINKTVSSFFEAPYDVSEAYSEACVVLHRAAISYDLGQTEVTFGLYARVCIRNRIIDMLRQKKAEPVVSDVDIETLTVRGGIEERLIMTEAVENYRRIARSVLSKYEYKIFLCVLKGLKTAEIADLLGKSAKSVDNAKSRIWHVMRETLGHTES